MAASGGHGLGGRDAGGFARRAEGGEQGHSNAGRYAARDRPGREENVSGRAADVEGFDRAGHQLDGAIGENASQRETKQGSQEAEKPGFQQNRRQHSSAGGAERAQNADLGASPNDRHRDGVVDQERPDYQRDVTQHAQVPAEGAEHLLVLSGAGALRPQGDPVGDRAAQQGFPTALDFLAGNADFNAVEPPGAPHHPLSKGNVHHDEIFANLLGKFVVGQYALDDEGVPLVMDTEAQRFAAGKTHGRADPHGVAFGECPDVERFAPQHRFNRGVSNQIEAQQVDRATLGKHDRGLFDPRGYFERIGQQRQVG